MTHDTPSYGLWGLVLVNSAVFILFAFSFFKPQNKRDWRTFGSFSAFLIALFAEMYGFPLTIYLLSGWLQRRFPEADIFSHEGGHLWYSLLGLEGDPHFHPVHLASHAVIAFGFLILAASWKILYDAQRDRRLATTGPYAYVRHPQYVGFILIMLGFLLQWPTFLTLLMFPILVVMYVRLAQQEERSVRARFGNEWDLYEARTPGFLPRPWALRPGAVH